MQSVCQRESLLHCSTDVEPDEEDSSHVRDAEGLLRERRPTAANGDELLELMRVTRNVRRNWIVSHRPSITDIIQRFPRLTDLPNAVSVS